MRKTKEYGRTEEIQSLCIARDELPKLLGCGQATADRLSVEAKARIKVGKRVLIRLNKLEEYLDSITE